MRKRKAKAKNRKLTVKTKLKKRLLQLRLCYMRVLKLKRQLQKLVEQAEAIV